MYGGRSGLYYATVWRTPRRAADTPAGGGLADTPAGSGQADTPAGTIVLVMDIHAYAMGEGDKEGAPRWRQGGCINTPALVHIGTKRREGEAVICQIT